jgi:hypothetical protein
MHKVIQLISNFLNNKNVLSLLCESRCSLDELDEKPNEFFFQIREILKERFKGEKFNF